MSVLGKGPRLRRQLIEIVAPPASALLPARQRHWQMVGVAGGVVLLSAALDVLPGGRVALHGLHGYPAPGVCLSRELFGVPCPACGLTRSFIFLAHGDWANSLAVHRLGWLVALLVLLQFPYRALCLRYPNRVWLPKPWPQLLGWGLILALVVNWMIGFVEFGGQN